MMTHAQLASCLERLRLTRSLAADLLQVDRRTLGRWLDGTQEVPGPAEQAFRAWLKLDELGLAWRPDSRSILTKPPQELAAHLAHAIGLVALIKRAKARGAPPTPWLIDLKKRRAMLGPIELSFHPLRNGSFSPASYTRRDREPDVDRDWSLLEEGIAAFADAVGKAGPDWAAE
jgi:hypothetical protein